MNTKGLLSLAFLSTLAIAATSVSAEPNLASEKTIFCQLKNNTLTTLVKSSNNKVLPIFHWKEKALPVETDLQQMCDRVAEKLENYLASTANLSDVSFKSVKLENIPTICLSEDNNSCNLVLFTLAPDPEPVETANRVLELILDPKLKDNRIISSERGVQSTSYSISFWELLDLEFEPQLENRGSSFFEP